MSRPLYELQCGAHAQTELTYFIEAAQHRSDYEASASEPTPEASVDQQPEDVRHWAGFTALEAISSRLYQLF
jgi:hypothetical protein